MTEGPTSHRWEDWVWDETVFEGTAAYYRQGRKPYAPRLADALVEHLHLDGRGRLLDVGCGPGTVALLFAHLFESVIGLDPDPGMLAEARRAAAGEHITNANWIRMRAESLPGSLDTFRVISFGQSFHWMDRPKVASAVREMLDADGAVVQVDLWHTTPPGQVPPSGPYPPIPEAAIDGLRRRWLGPDRRAGQGFRNTSPAGEDAVFQAAGFAPEELVIVPDNRVLERSVEDVVAWVLSTLVNRTSPLRRSPGRFRAGPSFPPPPCVFRRAFQRGAVRQPPSHPQAAVILPSHAVCPTVSGWPGWRTSAPRTWRSLRCARSSRRVTTSRSA